MTVAEPRVSTAGRLRIRAWRRSIRWVPSARQTVTTAGRPSGTAAMARLTAVRNISSSGWPRSRPTPNTTAQMAREPYPSHLPSWFSLSCSGVSSVSTVRSISAIRPSWVFTPVSVTTPVPRP